MDVRFINPFITACHQLFDRHLGMQVTVGRPHLKGTSAEAGGRFAVSIAIDLSGSVRGRVKLHVTQPVALALASSLSGNAPAKVDDECLDALREIANMIVGTAKRDFPGDLTKISTPQLVSSNFDEWRHDRRVLVVPMKCMAGELEIEVKIQSVDKPKAAKPAAPPVIAVDASNDVNQAQVDEMVERLLAAQA